MVHRHFFTKKILALFRFSLAAFFARDSVQQSAVPPMAVRSLNDASAGPLAEFRQKTLGKGPSES